MDLVGRKLGQAGGQNLQAFLGDIGKFVAKWSSHPTLGDAVKRLSLAAEAIGGSAMKLLMWFQSGHLALVPLTANRFLEMMSELSVGWMLLEGAVVAEEKKKTLAAGHADLAFYAGKTAAALYYARNVLPGVEFKARIMADEDRTPLEIPDAAFATV
jgi:hypothetical protein